MHGEPMFFQGLILGFSIAAPVGPLGLLCIQRTLSRGRLHGFVSGLGIATADTCYGLVAAFGLQALAQFLLGLQFWLQLGGGLFLLIFGLHIARSRPVARPAEGDNAPGLVHAWFSLFLLTLANPATILSFLVAFGALGLATNATHGLAACTLVAGVFLGSAAWWLTLSYLAEIARAHLTDGRLRVINLVAGSLIAGLGLIALGPLVYAKLLS